LAWDGSECKLTFTPSEGLLPSTDYTVSVSAIDLQDLAVEHEWCFSAGEAIPEFGSALIPAILILSMVFALSARRLRRR